MIGEPVKFIRSNIGVALVALLIGFWCGAWIMERILR